MELSEIQLCLQALHLVEGASFDDIKKAHKELSLSLHPDKNPPEEKEECSARFIRMQAAFEYLSAVERGEDVGVPFFASPPEPDTLCADPTCPHTFLREHWHRGEDVVIAFRGGEVTVRFASLEGLFPCHDTRCASLSGPLHMHWIIDSVVSLLFFDQGLLNDFCMGISGSVVRFEWNGYDVKEGDVWASQVLYGICMASPHLFWTKVQRYYRATMGFDARQIYEIVPEVGPQRLWLDLEDPQLPDLGADLVLNVVNRVAFRILHSWNPSLNQAIDLEKLSVCHDDFMSAQIIFPFWCTNMSGVKSFRDAFMSCLQSELDDEQVFRRNVEDDRGRLDFCVSGLKTELARAEAFWESLEEEHQVLWLNRAGIDPECQRVVSFTDAITRMDITDEDRAKVPRLPYLEELAECLFNVVLERQRSEKSNPWLTIIDLKKEIRSLEELRLSLDERAYTLGHVGKVLTESLGRETRRRLIRRGQAGKDDPVMVQMMPYQTTGKYGAFKIFEQDGKVKMNNMPLPLHLDYRLISACLDGDVRYVMHRFEFGCGRKFLPKLTAKDLRIAQMDDGMFSVKSVVSTSVITCGLCGGQHQSDSDLLILRKESASGCWTLWCWVMFCQKDLSKARPYQFGPASLLLEDSYSEPPPDLCQEIECVSDQQEYCFGKDDDWVPTRRVNLIRSYLGTGKTHRIVEQIFRWTIMCAGYSPPRVVILSPRRVYAQNVTQRYQNELQKKLPGVWERYPPFRCYTEWKENTGLRETQPLRDYPRIVIQVESLHKLGTDFDYDFVIVDECESILSQLCSFTTHKQNHSINLQIFERLLKLPKARIFLCDAFLARNTWTLVRHLFANQLSSVGFYHNKPIKRNTRLVVLPSADDWCTKAKELLAQKQKIFMVWSSRTKMLDFAGRLQEQKLLENSACLLYSSSEYLLVLPNDVVNSLSDDERRSLIEDDNRDGFWKIRSSDTVNDIQRWWNLDCIRLVACSPTITVGLDFPLKQFDATFISTAPTGSGTVRDAVQAHLRVRQTKSQVVYGIEPDNAPHDLEKLTKPQWHIRELHGLVDVGISHNPVWKFTTVLPQWFLEVYDWEERRRVIQAGWHGELFFRYMSDECLYEIVCEGDGPSEKVEPTSFPFQRVSREHGEYLRECKSKYKKLTQQEQVDLNRYELLCDFKSNTDNAVLSSIWNKYIAQRCDVAAEKWVEDQLPPADAYFYVARIESRFQSVESFIGSWRNVTPMTFKQHQVAMFQMILLLKKWLQIPHSQTETTDVGTLLKPHLAELKIAVFQKWHVVDDRILVAERNTQRIFVPLKKKDKLFDTYRTVQAFEKQYPVEQTQAITLASCIFTRWSRMKVDKEGKLCRFSDFPAFYNDLVEHEHSMEAMLEM